MSMNTAQPEEVQPERSARRGLWKPIVLVVVIVGLFFAAKAFGLDQKLGAMRDWIAGLGPWGPVVFAAVYVVATVLAVPGSALTVLAGGLFGSVLGVVCVSIASTAGAALCFLIARYLARDSVARSMAASEKFRRLDELTERQGWIVVAITRLVPLFPFNLLNYGFGLTRVPFLTYVLVSWVCMLPGTVLYVVGTDAVVTGMKEGRVPWPLVIVVVVVLALLAVIVRHARRRMSTDTPGKEPDGEPTQEGQQ